MEKKAEILARSWHKGQYRDDGTEYIEHVESVVSGLSSSSALMRTVAWLHDILEDTKMTISGLDRLGFTDEVINHVIHMTRVDGEDYIADYVKKRVGKCEVCNPIKISDITHNLSTLQKRYEKRKEKYKKSLKILILS